MGQGVSKLEAVARVGAEHARVVPEARILRDVAGERVSQLTLLSV